MARHSYQGGVECRNPTHPDRSLGYFRYTHRRTHGVGSRLAVPNDNNTRPFVLQCLSSNNRCHYTQPCYFFSDSTFVLTFTFSLSSSTFGSLPASNWIVSWRSLMVSFWDRTTSFLASHLFIPSETNL